MADPWEKDEIVKSDPDGMLERGNIDLGRRPVIDTTEGGYSSYSTVKSMSFNDKNHPGPEILIPRVSADGSRILSEDEAVEQYRKTGQHLGKFDTPEHADAYAQSLHEQQAQQYGSKAPWENDAPAAQPVAAGIPQSLLGRLGHNIWDEAKEDVLGPLHELGVRYGESHSPEFTTRMLAAPKMILPAAALFPPVTAFNIGAGLVGRGIEAATDGLITRENFLTSLWGLAPGRGGVKAAPWRDPARITDPAVKATADQAAAETLKPVDDALANGGLTPGTGKAAENDLSNAGVLSGAHSEFSRAAQAGGEQKVGHLPNREDFDNAAKVLQEEEPSKKEQVHKAADQLSSANDNVDTAAVTAKLQKLYETLAVHPAEAVHDAAANPETRASLLSPDPADLPREYDPWAQIPDAYGFHGYEPQPEFPARVDRSIENLNAAGIEAARREPYFQNVPAGGKPKTAPEVKTGGGGEGNLPPNLPGSVPSFGLPEGGGFDVYGHPEGPAARKPIYSYSQQDRNAFRKALDFVVDSYKHTFQPELVSDTALKADPEFARYKSATQAEKDSILHDSEAHHQYWRRKTDTERIGYLDKMERGDLKDMPDDVRAEADRHRVLMNEAMIREKEKGSKASWIEDYFTHIWQDPDKARNFVNLKTAQLGPKWFQNERVFKTIRDGLDAGLRLKSTNPEDLVTMRLLASADMVERMGLLERLRDMNLAVKIVEGSNSKGELERTGWQMINAPDRGQWAIAPDIQPLWKNAVEAKGFWANEGMPGSVFRGWMAFKNVWVPIKLALSGFHFLHVLHINWNEGFARAWTQITKSGDIAGGLKSAAEGFYGGFQAAIPGMPHEGKSLRAAWKIPEAERTPEQRAAVELMKDGGFVPELSEQLRINAKHSLEDAIDKGEWIKAGPQAIRRTLEKIQAPLFQEWIPNLKAAAYVNDARALLDRHPEYWQDDNLRRTALRTIAKSIDNRYGEMFYGGLFWNRYVKDTGIGSFLSLGWNLGFAREFVAGPLESVARTANKIIGNKASPTEAAIADAQNKMPFVISYVATGMLINGIMSYGFSGKMPEGLDWFLARIGGANNPDGSPRRITNMSYLREVPMAIKHVQEHGGNVAAGLRDMIYNKMMIEPVKELLQNKDYYGSEIYDENGPLYMRAAQMMKFIFAEQFNPISISGARRAFLTSGNWGEAALAMLGFGPAPAYVSRSATQNRIEYLYKQHVLPESKPYVEGQKAKDLYDIRSELLKAKADNDRPAMADAARKWLAAGGSKLAMSNMIMGVPGDIAMFRGLKEADQQAIMQQATPDERKKYQPFVKTNTAARAADLLYQYQTLSQQGNAVAAENAKQQMDSLIRDAVANGTVTDGAAFRRSVSQQLIARRAPELSALMQLPKKLRPQYAPNLQGPQ